MRNDIHRSLAELPLSLAIGHPLCIALGFGLAVLSAWYGGSVRAVCFTVGLFIAALGVIHIHSHALHARLDGVQREIEILRMALRSRSAGKEHE